MSRWTPLQVVLAVLLAGLISPVAAFAHSGLILRDPFAQMTPKSGAVYFLVQNHADDDDRLLSASSPQAEAAKVMVRSSANGATEVVEAPDGLVIAAYDTVVLSAGQSFVMLIGPKRKFEDGDTIDVTLTFANSGPIRLTVPVVNGRSTPPTETRTAFDVETHSQMEATTSPPNETMAVQPGNMSMPEN